MISEEVRSTIKKYGLLNNGDLVLAGVSGGPDSLTLLYLLLYFKKEFNLKLHIAHFDHLLRKDSASDRKFVERIARKLNIPVTSEKIDINLLSKKGSREEICREARLAFLFKTAKNIKADKIALGHNLDDQAETVLMRLLRGSGLYGLSGIIPKKEISGFTIIRPLLEVKRKAITAFLKKKKIRPRIDSSNSRDIYFRNKIRNKLIPLLEKNYNRNIKEILSNTAESVARDYDFLNRVSLKTAARFKPAINLKKFNRIHPAVRRMVLRDRICRLKGNTRTIAFKHIREIEDLILNRPINSLVDLPGNIRVKKTGHSLVFRKR